MFPISSQDHFVYANISASVDMFSENMEELDKYLICISEKFPYSVRCFNTFYLEILIFIHNQPHHDRWFFHYSLINFLLQVLLFKYANISDANLAH